MIENTTTAVPTVTADFLTLGDPQALVDAHAAAIAAGQVPLAEDIARFVAYVGHELRATTVRVGQELTRCHESRYDDLHAETDEAEARLQILEAVPALRAAIDGLSKDEVDEIWAQYGPYECEDDE